MKKILLSLILVTGFMLQKSDAQISIGFNASINISSQPDWGPSGYDYAQYYYFPDIDVYYDIANREFVYFDNGQWIYSSELPSFCQDFDLYGSYKVVINEARPYLRADFYRREYSKYRGYHGQQIIRDRRDNNNGYSIQPVYNDRRNLNERNQGLQGRDNGQDNQQQGPRRDNNGQQKQQQNGGGQWNSNNNNGGQNTGRGNGNVGQGQQNGGGQGQHQQDQRFSQKSNTQQGGQNDNRSASRDNNSQKRKF